MADLVKMMNDREYVLHETPPSEALGIGAVNLNLLDPAIDRAILSNQLCTMGEEADPSRLQVG